MKKLGILMGLIGVILLTACSSDAEKTTDLHPVYDSEEKKFGYIDSKGKWAIKPQFREAQDFSDGVALVENYGDYVYINEKGEVEFKPKRQLMMGLGYRPFSEGLSPIKDNGKLNYMNKEGEYELSLDYELYQDLDQGFHQGLAIFIKETEEGQKRGYLNKKGEIEIEAIYNQSGIFSEDLAFVEEEGKYYYINKKSEKEFEIRKDENSRLIRGFPFQDGVALIEEVVNFDQTDRYYIDKKGKKLSSKEVEDKLGFKPHFSKDKKFVSLDGKEMEFDFEISFIAEDFNHQPLAKIYAKKGEDETYLVYVNREGKVVWNGN